MRETVGSARGRISYANVVATLALFVALGGSAWAVGANSVGSKQLKTNAVKAKHVAKNAIRTKELRPAAVKPASIEAGAVRTPKVADEAVTTAKLADGAVTAEKLADGLLLTGPPGDPGADGTAVAYGSTNAGGTVDLTRSKSLTDDNIVHPETGLYCIENVPATTFVAVANINVARIVTVNNTPQTTTKPVGCPGSLAATIGAVRMFDLDGDPINSGFTILLDD